MSGWLEPAECPCYLLPRSAGVTAGGGTFHGHVLFVVIIQVLRIVSPQLPPPWLMWASVILALALSTAGPPPFRPSELVPQLISFARLSRAVLRDLLPQLAVAFALLAVFGRVLDASGHLLLWGFEGSWGALLYWTYFAVRLLFLAHLLATGEKRHRNAHVSAFLLGNVGLVVRCFKYEMWRGAAAALLGATGAGALALEPTLWARAACVMCVGLALAREIAQNAEDNLLFYKIHRTIHAEPRLHALLHALHHRAAAHTTLLDSGTISPLELWWTDASMPALLLCAPPFFSLGFETIAAAWHFAAHGWTGGAEGDATHHHHLAHHRNPAVNFGLLPKYDARFGTLKKA